MSRCLDDLQPINSGQPRFQQSLYQKDLTSIEKMIFNLKTVYENKSLTPSQFNTYHKNIHEIHILLNSFLKNSFQLLSKKDTIGCLRNWQSLLHDQNEKTNYMIKRYLEINAQLQNKNTSLIQKVTSTCERCYHDMRRVNIGEVKDCLENQYMGTLDRMIAEAKVQINGQLFTEEEDQMFFKQLHNTLKKKHDQIEFNNKSIESLINKITKEISELNIMKKMSIEDSGQLEPPTYTWMRNIKSALNDLLQTTFKKKVPMFIENMVKLFEEHLDERNKLLHKPMQTQTDDYENSQIAELKQKIIRFNGQKFKLQNDLRWVENQLQNTKTQFNKKIHQHNAQLQEKWNELTQQKQNNKRLKGAIQVITKQTDAVKDELRKKIQQQRKRQKSTPKKFQNEKEDLQIEQTRNTFLKKTMSEKVKNSFSFQPQNIEKPNTAQKTSKFSNPASQTLGQNKKERKQRFKQGQQQSIPKSKVSVSKAGLKFRKSQKPNIAPISGLNLKRKISQSTLIVNHQLAERMSLKSEGVSEASSKMRSVDEEEESQNEDPDEVEDNDDHLDPENHEDSKDHIDSNDQENRKNVENSNSQKVYQGGKRLDENLIEKVGKDENLKNHKTPVQRRSKQKFKLSMPKSIIIEEENSETVQNYDTPVNRKQRFVQALQSIKNTYKKPSQPSESQISQYCDNIQQNIAPQQNMNNDLYAKTCNDSELRSSLESMTVNVQKRYNEEVIRVNQLMEKKIKRLGIMAPSRLSKQSLIGCKTFNKLYNQFNNNHMRIDQKPEEDSIVEMTPNLLRKYHLRSQTTVNNNHKATSFKDKNINQYQDHEGQTQKSQTPRDLFTKNTFKVSEYNSGEQNSNQVMWKNVFDTQNFSKDVEQLMKQIKSKIKTGSDCVQDIKIHEDQKMLFRNCMMDFLQKYGIQQNQLAQNDEELKPETQFQRKCKKSVSFFRSDQSNKKIKQNQTNGFAKKSQLQQPVQAEQNRLPIMYKTCFNTPQNNKDTNKNGKNTRISTHNISKRNVWKSLPDEVNPQNQSSIEKAKANNKRQRPLLRDIKNYGHNKHESCEIGQNNQKQALVKVDIFTKEDFNLFIDQANAHSYECAHMKRQPRMFQIQQSSDYQTLIDSIFMNLQQIKQQNSGFYDQIVSFIRYPYHTVKNLSWGACMVKGIKYESFVKFMERIIYLHRKCPVSEQLGYCAHLNIFSRKIQFVKRQAVSLMK